jgi:carbamoyltransferase
MRILGLGGSGHSFSACLVENGRVVCAIEEERLNRIKHSLLPDNSIEIARAKAAKYCLHPFSSSSEIDMIISNDFINPLYYSKYMNKIILINHHLAHASSAYFCSPFMETAILIADGCGSRMGPRKVGHTSENETTTFYYAHETTIREIKKTTGELHDGYFPSNSIGDFYDCITQGIGFKFLEEGKVMGLAPYGRDTYVQALSRFYSLDQQGNFFRTHQQMKNMRSFIQDIIHKSSSEEESFQIRADLAYAGQYHLESILVHLCQYLYTQTQTKKLCLAGGVFFNSVANYKLLEQTPFEEVYIFPAAGDAGTSIGSALYGHYVLNGQSREISSAWIPYLGKEYSNVEYLEAIEKYKGDIDVEEPEDLCDVVALLLSEDKVIAWFQGRSEFGPRALGNRSILANTSNDKMRDRLNQRVKYREWFRPFAPIVLEEFQNRYFSLTTPSYDMLLVSPIRKERQSEIPSAVHVDGTGRLQTVSKQRNPQLHELLTSFYQRTGTPILLNTSFNERGRPIVESPSDAIVAFLRMELDYLVLQNKLITKKRFTRML